ncbi:MAG: gamma-glutamyltransferase, partial [Phycisphaerae bacterium]
MPVNEAVAAPRRHHHWLPDVLHLQPGFDASTIKALRDRGHTIRRAESIADVQAIARTNSGWRGACDPAKGGQPAGE